MLTIVRSAPKFTGKEEVVLLPLFEGQRRLEGLGKKLDVLSRGSISAIMRKGHFSGRLGESLLFSQNLPKAPNHILLLGLGKMKSLTAETMARSAGIASQSLLNRKFRACHVVAEEGGPLETFIHSFLKGFVLAQYRFKITSRKSQEARLRKVVILARGSKGLVSSIRTARVVIEQTEKVRDLVNCPADTMTPTRMAQEARSLAKAYGFQCRVMGPRDIRRLKMGAVLGVARGSREEPRFITLHYNKGLKKLPRVCLIGKGVTFDSGGISIKPWNDMNEMKGDMAGGAVVMSTVAAAAREKLPVEIIAIVPCVENMPDGSAFRPGDVITTYAGKTIEIISTDAEGRLILADALTYAREFKPAVIVDFATLTGAVVIALGKRIAGAIGNNQGYIDRLIAAGVATGERVWQLPLDDSFSESVRGDISDYKNYGGRDGSTITAAALLAEFAGNTPWVHVDIAGTFWSDGSRNPSHPKGATGYGVDLTLSFLRSIAMGE